jgi:hypothetical protein
MFFHISNQVLDNFPEHFAIGDLVVNVDAGWKCASDRDGNLLLFKGYVDDRHLDHVVQDIAEQHEPFLRGNFCVLRCTPYSIEVKTDRLRSFPIWHGAEGLTNLRPLEHQIWADSVCTVGNKLLLVETKFDLLREVEVTPMDLDTVTQEVDHILTDKIQAFAEINDLPLRVFVSGGIDTMLIYAYVRSLNIPHQLIDYQHTDLDYFYVRNQHHLERSWAYRQIHHWREHCVLASGAPGDEFTLRNPVIANMILSVHGTDVLTLLQDHPDCMHRDFFTSGKYVEALKHQEHYTDLTEATRAAMNRNVNDYQHWHLGNTLTWTPFRDPEIFQLIAGLPLPDLADQVLDSVVQRRLIEQHAPELLGCLSVQKNSSNSLELTWPILAQQI